MVMRWKLILGESGSGIQRVYVVGNIVADMISRFPYTHVDKYNTSTVKAQCCVNKIFTPGRDKNNEDFPTKSLEGAKRKTKRA